MQSEESEPEESEPEDASCQGALQFHSDGRHAAL